MRPCSIFVSICELLITKRYTNPGRSCHVVVGSQGETYTLFQDKVDEAEARLEVSTASYSVCKKR